MEILHDNLNEDSASTFSSVFSSRSSSFRSTDSSVSNDAESNVLDEPSPNAPTTAAEANALFERLISAPVETRKRPHSRRVFFVAAREPSLNHDVQELSSLTQSILDAPLDEEVTQSSAAVAPVDHNDSAKKVDGSEPLALPTVAAITTEESNVHRLHDDAPNRSNSSLGLGAVEQAPVNQIQASSAKQTASQLSAKTLAAYRHLKYVLRQRLLRRYYDLWGRWVMGTPSRRSPSSGTAHASVSTQTLSVDHEFLCRRGMAFKGSDKGDPDWNADVESMETVSVAGSSSLDRQSITPRMSASRGSSPGSGGGGLFTFPEPLPEQVCLGATSRPARLVDYGARSDRPRPKGPQRLSQPSTGLPSVVENPLRVVHLPTP